MALPAPVDLQLTALNAAVNKLLTDRERIRSAFDDALGGSVYGLLTVQNQAVFKNAVVADMQSAVTSLQSVVTALGAM